MMINGTPERFTTKAFERDLAEIEGREGNPAQEMKSWPIYVALKVFKHACHIQRKKNIFRQHLSDRDHQKNLQHCQIMLEWGLEIDNARGQFVRLLQSENSNIFDLSPDSGQRQDLRPSAGKESEKISRLNNRKNFEEYQNYQVQHRFPLRNYGYSESYIDQHQGTTNKKDRLGELSQIRKNNVDSSKKNSERDDDFRKMLEEMQAKQERQAAKQERQAKQTEKIMEQLRRLDFRGQGKKKTTGEKRNSRPSVTMMDPGERKRSHSKKEQEYNQPEKCEKRSSRSRGKGKGTK